MSYETTLERWHIRTVDEDWPVGLPKEEREPLVELVRKVMGYGDAKKSGYSLDGIRQRVTWLLEKKNTCPTFRGGYDFQFACIERALRECGAEQRWHPKEGT